MACLWRLLVHRLFKSRRWRRVTVESRFGAIGNLKSLYSDLPGAIHGGRVTDLEMRVALNKIVFEQKALDQHIGLWSNVLIGNLPPSVRFAKSFRVKDCLAFPRDIRRPAPWEQEQNDLGLPSLAQCTSILPCCPTGGHIA